jgi:hypothetical protein
MYFTVQITKLYVTVVVTVKNKYNVVPARSLGEQIWCEL